MQTLLERHNKKIDIEYLLFFVFCIRNSAFWRPRLHFFNKPIIIIKTMRSFRTDFCRQNNTGPDHFIGFSQKNIAYLLNVVLQTLETAECRSQVIWCFGAGDAISCSFITFGSHSIHTLNNNGLPLTSTFK